MNSRILGLDIGGTKLAAAQIRVHSRPSERRPDVVMLRRSATPFDMTASREILSALVGEVSSGGAFDAVGVSFGGLVDAVRGIVRTSHHVGGWAGWPLQAELAERYGVPCALLNDADAGAVAEQRWGAGRGLADVVYVTVSTGVGAGLVLDGRLHKGAHGMAGEVGHLPITAGGPVCACGRRGCVEAFASGPAIARAARAALTADPAGGTVLREICGGDIDAVDARAVSTAAARGDALAVAVLGEAGRALGIGLAAAALLLDPDVIVLGGGVVNSGASFLANASAVVAERVLGDPPTVVLSALGPEAPLYGAAAAAMDLIDTSER